MSPPPGRSAGGEESLIDWLRRRTAGAGGELIGDDAAVLPEPGPWAVTLDAQIEDVHFPAGLDPAWVARRLLAVNLSDLAAAGATPAYAFLSLAAPAAFDHRRFFRAFTDACRRHGTRLAGGDLARQDHVGAVLTLLGRKAGTRWLARSGAEPGHELWVGGTLGEAAAGLRLLRSGPAVRGATVRLPPGSDLPRELRPAARRAVRRHLAPTPQLDLGTWLGRQPAGAAIDVSDGLARDLHRLCRESGVGAEVDVARLPTASGFEALCEALGLDPGELALGGGEDYVLLFSLPPEREPPRGWGCRRIGRLEARRGVRALRGGRRERLPLRGWDHFADGTESDGEGRETPPAARRSLFGRGAL